MSEKIAILGCGNGGHAAAADLTLKGFEVTMYEDPAFKDQHQELFKHKIVHLQGAAGTGDIKIHDVTTNLEQAVKGATIILVVVPAFVHASLAKKLAIYIEPGQIVCLLPGTFGSLIFYKEFKKVGVNYVPVAESHTLPYATRLIAPATSLVMSRFNPLKIGVIPANKTDEVLTRLSHLFDGLEAVESVIACGLSSLNPIIHVPGCILNAGRIEIAKGDFHFYTEGFSDSVVRATEAIDNERIHILKQFGYAHDIAAHGVGGSIQSDSIKEVIASDPNFAKITGPANFKNRYYAEDIPFGLASWAKLANAYDVATPIMDSMVNLGSLIMEEDCWSIGRSLGELGIEDMSLEDLKNYVQNG
ncbi:MULTISPECIES: NAD/NADP-dependent octopine/nopaline dehydrogenase family protein [unclassified Breznakia]|uniref:NAD/NADP octopine/nopaline dehydrogenase family protein n=1 Tax=unclassified Breznakia TaxID=2623764 RepID=UPI0024735EF0|nr:MULTISPECIES: NAD/NADP-dependent octopine/nopaline dehydrogenase family protein [unclassified Breznakia]MDH6366796.1 opine dehydrogenase [Breznakia sp. PH1-1]MDH6403817.1 opine dehydrogenase [Breznakia sp. PF1-11]MDH6411526.1 opine dehydrogenase [Breznakia sp. PFB1-11]MDH6413890.1 opine dehydrogenase [Breznakia sp. PFB1-14]MDH6416319.1 opine dehydrogenase [Breznakia sp. PFB1-4]